ncbi:MAG TPA: cytochrome c oxidase subunit 3 [Polyangiaceae bacterium]|jgi:cytochrome c oxidase subunit I+III|nr:cytochrome c oxidase subunit 3 [Polyangiaceae bacterium]
MNEHSALEPALDLSQLPRFAQGPRAPLWWGTMLLICIESTCFGMLFACYLYVRNNFDEWPPQERLSLAPGATSLFVLLLTLFPTWLYRRAAHGERFLAMRRWLVIATALSVASVAVRAWEIRVVPFEWTGSAYASVVWMSLGMHTVEIVTGAVESVFMCLILFRHRIERKSFEDVEESASFWFFSVLVWLPFALLFYLDGRIR